jgi:hypothetical protein
MTIPNQQLLQELLDITLKNEEIVSTFLNFTDQELNFKKSPDSWSILECIEHLNLYGDYYIPTIQKTLTEQSVTATSDSFKPGILGNYFANAMRTVNGKTKKMKSPKNKNPANSKLERSVLNRFMSQSADLKNLLNQAKGKDLTRMKTPISLTKLIKLRLGDTFRFYTYHIERHVAQAQRVHAH